MKSTCFATEQIFTRSQFIPAPVESVFAFFSDPHNLARLTPPAQRMRLPENTPHKMSEGMELAYRFKLGPIPMRWTAKIVRVQAPSLFEDVQLKGPFLSWTHQHRFEPTEGGTRILDEIHYRSPTCKWGNRWFVRPRLESLFAFRAAALESVDWEERN